MTDQIFNLEQAVLALEDNPNFHVFLQALETARDTYYRKQVLGLAPTADNHLELQRRLGHLEGLDELCGSPAAMKLAADRKRNRPKQQYEGRNEITPIYSTEEEDDN